MIRRGAIVKTNKNNTIFRCKCNSKLYCIPNDELVITNKRESNFTGQIIISVDIPDYIYNN